MTALPFVFAGLVILIGAVTWRPHGWGPAVGAAAAVLAASLGGAVELGDLRAACGSQWQAFVTLASVMAMTSTAERLGLVQAHRNRESLGSK
ncbi:MAG: hypothetical protein IPM79_35085 [Polyangiaceae bacterium]|nr:hypothetical protein [Polyangiaceae bacterium]